MSTIQSIVDNGNTDTLSIILFLSAILVIFVIFIIFTKNLVKLLGWKNFFILIVITTVLNNVVSFITSCFGTKNKIKEKFPTAGLLVFAIIVGILIAVLSFQYYIVKYLGFRNYIILILVLSTISSISGYMKNCL